MIDNQPVRIGRVVWGDPQRIASLFSDGSWTFTIAGEPVPAMALGLRGMFLDEYAGPSDGFYGHKMLAELAEKNDGAVILDDQPAADRLEIY